MTHDLREAHFTNEQLNTMYEASKRDAHFVGSEIRQLIGDIRTAREALTASAPNGEPVGYAVSINGEVQLSCFRKKRHCAERMIQDHALQGAAVVSLYTSPPPAAGWECLARKQSFPEPGECNWPSCGCDPLAMKVIGSLIEQGWQAPEVGK